MKKKLLAGIIAGVMTLSMAGTASAAVVPGADVQKSYEIKYDKNGNATMISYDEGVSEPVCGVRKNKKSNFTLKIKSGIKGYKCTGKFWLNKKTLQVVYKQRKGKNKNEITICKAKGKCDISGDQRTWAMTATATVNGKKIKFRGNKKAVCVATWKAGKYTYSVTFARPVRLKTMTNLVKKIK